MSILRETYYDSPARNYVTPSWIKCERYEYCDGFYSSQPIKKNSGLLSKIASLLTSIF